MTCMSFGGSDSISTGFAQLHFLHLAPTCYPPSAVEKVTFELRLEEIILIHL